MNLESLGDWLQVVAAVAGSLALDPESLASWLQFVESLVASLAWPIAVVVIVVVLRGRLNALLDRIQNVEGMGLKATFGQEASNVRAEVEGTLRAEVEGIPVELAPVPTTSADQALPTDGEGAESPDAETDETATPAGSGGDEQTPRPPMEATRRPLKETGERTHRGRPPTEFSELESVRARLVRQRVWFKTVDASIDGIQQLAAESSSLSTAAKIGLVIATWSHVERALFGACASLDLPSGGGFRRVSDVLGALVGRGAMTYGQANSILELKRLRDDAAHAMTKISDRAASDYTSASLGALELLKKSVLRKI